MDIYILFTGLYSLILIQIIMIIMYMYVGYLYSIIMQ